MNKTLLHIAIGLYVVVECVFLMLGDTLSKWWSVAYFVNQSVLIVGLLVYLSDHANIFLINAIIFLNLIKIAYNLLVAINDKAAEMVNSSIYLGAVLILLLITSIMKRKNDRKRKIEN